MSKYNIFFKIYKDRDLIMQLTKRERQMRHKGSRLGNLWALISPCMMLGLYLFIFGFIFKSRFGVIPNETFFDFALAMFLGLSIFNLISETISSSPNIIISQPNYVKKVVFPLYILSICKVLTSLYFTLVSILICCVLIPFSSTQINFKAFIYLPIILLPLIIICLGLSWGIAAIGVFYRDLNHLTGFISTSLMYASAIVYAPAKLPLQIFKYLKYNPILLIVDQFRKLLLWNNNINISDLIIIYIISIIIFMSGYYTFKTLKPYFAEVI